MNFSTSIDGVDESWVSFLKAEFAKPYMQQLQDFLSAEQRHGKVIYPLQKDIFNAFAMTPLSKVKVVILGQDPYHGLGQAHGLSFSVPTGVKIPPSLNNIFKEIERDLGLQKPVQGSLQSWAEQGVLLLNATLTVEESKAGSHQGKGWERFSDNVIQYLNDYCGSIVFLLWGAYAQKKGQIIDVNKHCVLTSAHPSPLSAHRGFIGNEHFSLANQWLISQNNPEINWQL